MRASRELPFLGGKGGRGGDKKKKPSCNSHGFRSKKRRFGDYHEIWLYFELFVVLKIPSKTSCYQRNEAISPSPNKLH